MQAPACVCEHKLERLISRLSRNWATFPKDVFERAIVERMIEHAPQAATVLSLPQRQDLTPRQVSSMLSGAF